MLKTLRSRLRQQFRPRSTPSRPYTVTAPGPTGHATLPASGVDVTVEELIALRAQAASLGLSDQTKVRSAQAGGYVSPYRGRGIDFDEVRAYQPGDDIRSMDWRVTARTGQPHTKLYREERERPVLFLVDLGASMAFGTRVAFKSVVAARAAALITWAAVDNGDRVGAVIFTSDRHIELRPTARKRGALRIVRALAGVQAQPGAEAERGFAAALQRMVRIARPGSLVFVLSDFRSLDEESERLIARLTRHCDLLLLQVSDPLEARVPYPGRYPLSDGNARVTLDAGVATIRRAFESSFEMRRARLRDLCRQNAAHYFALRTDQPLPQALREGLRSYHAHPATLRATG